MKISQIQMTMVLFFVVFGLFSKPAKTEPVPLSDVVIHSSNATRTVRDIRVQGNYPILSKNIRKQIALQPGAYFNESHLADSIATIEKYLEKNGYYDSQVSITPRFHERYHTVDLIVRIQKGKTYKIRNVMVNGNQSIHARILKNKISRFLRFRPARLKKDLKRIKKMYVKKGFVRARIKVENLQFDDVAGKVDITLSVRENKKLRVEFIGKTVLSRGRLHDIIGLDKQNSYDRYAIRLAKQRLENHYKKNGFAHVDIKTEILKPTPQDILVRYYIHPGLRIELKEIKFEGNKKIGGKKLKSVILSQESALLTRKFFQEKKLIKDQAALRQIYKSKGFFDASIGEVQITENSFGDQKLLLFPIVEGQPYQIGSVHIASDKRKEERYLIKKSDLKTGKDFAQEDIIKAQEKITDILNNQGYAYAHLTTNATINHAHHSVDVDIRVDRGEKVRIGKIIISGNHLTREKVIRKNLKIREGWLFIYQQILDAQLNLRKLGVFSSVRITPLGFEEKKNIIDLIIVVTERKTLSFNIQAGFDNRHLGNGEISFTKYNLFGSARQFNIRGIVGQKYNRGEMTFYSPRVFGASWNLANQYFGEYAIEPNYVSASYGSFINTLKNYGPHWTFGFKEQVIHTEVYESKSNVALLGDSLFDNSFNEFQLSLLFDNRDNFSDPQKGAYILLRNELNTDLSDTSNNFNSIEINASHHQGFFKRFTLNNTLRYWHTFKITQNPRIPVNKLFFLGGADTVRGFEEDGLDPAGGTVAFIYNSELHFRITPSIKLAAFFDAGLLKDDINEIAWSDVRESAGVGLRYFTPIGPIRLDYGFILDRQADEPKSRLHFSFGYFF